MAPAVPNKGNQRASPRRKAPRRWWRDAAPKWPKRSASSPQAQANALKRSKWVGDAFAEQSRAMHYGERDAETIHGRATPARSEGTG